MSRVVIILFMLFASPAARSQCTVTINSFPYNNDFEVNDASWTTGGTLSDWQWGTPSKSVINSAASGTKAWMTGGLSSAGYNGGQRSWLMSPCFDLTSLVHPRISFSVFWETERRYDGASIEYSTDGGQNWNTLGNISSNNTCGNQNWFNYDPVQYLNNKPGWSGTISPTQGSCLGGNGSNGWVTAKHTLDGLQSYSQVKFRFTFGAGTVCNNYDGFAVDDFKIEDAPVVNTDFSYSCGTNNIVNFGTPQLECMTSVTWDFGDPASGSSNTATGLSPSHQFSSQDDYTVTMTVSFSNGPNVIVTKTVSLLQVSTSVISEVSCNGGNDGSATVNVSSGSGYTYQWNTVPAQNTPTATGLTAGNYSVIITAPGTGCTTTGEVVITEPSQLFASASITQPPVCNASNGIIEAAGTGGTSPYQYTWSTGATGSSLDNISAGNYSVIVTDANGCTSQPAAIEVVASNINVAVNLGADTTLCPGNTIILNPGSYSSYEWQDGSTSSTYTVSSPGSYTVTVSDANGCTGTDTRVIMACAGEIFFPNAFSPNGDGLNETFGPLGVLSGLAEYHLSVFDRYGNRVFTSRDPNQRWDGTVKGKARGNESFTWMCTYKRNGRPVVEKGVLVVVR